MPGEKGLHVLVVDDSAVVRQTLAEVLSRGGMTSESAPDPLIALGKIKLRRPDVVLLDLDMPRMDGLTFLRKLMAEDPLPVVVCSALGGAGTETALEAVLEGALEVVAKPSVGVRDFLEDSATVLLDAVRAASRARLSVRGRAGRMPVPAAPAARPAPAADPGRIIALGASTGGPEALERVLRALPSSTPGIVVVQHMPAGFTRAFAQRLAGLCKLEVKEAVDGDRVEAGRALIAPGNRHMVVEKEPGGLTARVAEGPLVSRHRPSVDVLFRSVARAAGGRAMGVLLTGMGEDGAEGLLEMRRAGAFTLAQDEATSVVFGMPKEALARGAAVKAVPLDLVAENILAWSARGERAAE